MLIVNCPMKRNKGYWKNRYLRLRKFAEDELNCSLEEAYEKLKNGEYYGTIAEVHLTTEQFLFEEYRSKDKT